MNMKAFFFCCCKFLRCGARQVLIDVVDGCPAEDLYGNCDDVNRREPPLIHGGEMSHFLAS